MLTPSALSYKLEVRWPGERGPSRAWRNDQVSVRPVDLQGSMLEVTMPIWSWGMPKVKVEAIAFLTIARSDARPVKKSSVRRLWRDSQIHRRDE